MRALLILFLFFPALVYCQVNSDGSSFQYKHDWQYGLGVHTQGYTFSTKFTKHKKYDTYRQIDVDWVMSVKHPTEILYPSYTGTGKPFVFGKQFELSILRALYGRQKMISDFYNPLSVRINVQYGIGPAVGLLKPVYLEVFLDNGTTDTEQIRFDSERLSSPNLISSGTSKLIGVSEMGFEPGISTKLALSFEWGSQDDKFKSLEVGMMLDAFTNVIPIMAFTDNKRFYYNLYATFSFGNRY